MSRKDWINYYTDKAEISNAVVALLRDDSFYNEETGRSQKTDQDYSRFYGIPAGRVRYIRKQIGMKQLRWRRE